MQAFQYVPYKTSGPNGTQIRYTSDEDSNLTEVGEYGGRHIAIAPDGATFPAQPAQITWQPQTQDAPFLSWLQTTRYWALFQQAKVKKQADRVKALETARESGFSHNGKNVSSDTKSQGLFNALNTEAGIAIAAGTQEAMDAFAAGLGVGWRATDGTVVAATAPEFRAMMQSWYAHVAATDAVSQGYKAAIDAAETLADLNAIDVLAGY